MVDYNVISCNGAPWDSGLESHPDIFATGFNFNCISVEVAESNEVRNYTVLQQVLRNQNGCYDLNDIATVLVAQVNVPCTHEF